MENVKAYMFSSCRCSQVDYASRGAGHFCARFCVCFCVRGLRRRWPKSIMMRSIMIRAIMIRAIMIWAIMIRSSRRIREHSKYGGARGGQEAYQRHIKGKGLLCFAWDSWVLRKTLLLAFFWLSVQSIGFLYCLWAQSKAERSLKLLAVSDLESCLISKAKQDEANAKLRQS